MASSLRMNKLLNDSFEEEELPPAPATYDQQQSQQQKVIRSSSYTTSSMNNALNSTNDNSQTAITNSTSEYKKSKTSRNVIDKQQQQQQQNQPNLEMDKECIYVDSKITFIQEKDFKFEKTCWVCKILFGKINERQHHCRLCSHSACKTCSEKRVNDQRVCDICFLKLKNMKGEKRKIKLLAAMKNFIKNLSQNVRNGISETQKLKEKQGQVRILAQKEQEARDNEIAELELKLMKLESSCQKAKQKAEEQESILAKKREEKLREQDSLYEIERKVQHLKTDNEHNEQTLQARENQLIQIRRQKLELENSESFLRLPNYERARRNDPEKICEAIIFLDSNDARNGINHYNTVSQDNVFSGSNAILSGTSQISQSKDSRDKKSNGSGNNQNYDSNNKSDYASSYNQGLMDEAGASEIIQHNARSGKKPKKNTGPGCFCD